MTNTQPTNGVEIMTHNNLAYILIAVFALLVISSIATTLPVFASVTAALG